MIKLLKAIGIILLALCLLPVYLVGYAIGFLASPLRRGYIEGRGKLNELSIQSAVKRNV